MYSNYIDSKIATVHKINYGLFMMIDNIACFLFNSIGYVAVYK